MSYLGPIGFSESRLENACEFHGDSYISHTPSVAASDLQHGSLSFWFRRSNLSAATRSLISIEDTGGAPQRSLQMYISSHKLNLYIDNGPAIVTLISTETVNDTDWHHALGVFDLDNGTQAERAKLYLDGAEVTYGTSTRPANTTTEFMGLFKTYAHEIGRNWVPGAYFEGVMGDVQLVQGLALTPASFGKTVDSAWVWKNYTGAHGSNGLRLKFDNPADLGENSAA